VSQQARLFDNQKDDQLKKKWRKSISAFGWDRPSVEPFNNWNEGRGGTLWEGRF